MPKRTRHVGESALGRGGVGAEQNPIQPHRLAEVLHDDETQCAIAAVLGKTWIRLYQASLDGALTLRGSWLSTGSAVAYSLAVLPHQELVLLGSSSMGYTGAFLLDADTVEVTPVQEVWVYGTLHPFVAAVPERRALGYFASDSKKGVSPMTAPWSWWYAPYPGDLQYLF